MEGVSDLRSKRAQILTESILEEKSWSLRRAGGMKGEEDFTEDFGLEVALELDAVGGGLRDDEVGVESVLLFLVEIVKNSMDKVDILVLLACIVNRNTTEI
jgi:hypothetical protein